MTESFQCAAYPYTTSLIQTILSVPEFHRVRSCQRQFLADCHRRWGITPRPEVVIPYLIVSC